MPAGRAPGVSKLLDEQEQGEKTHGAQEKRQDAQEEPLQETADRKQNHDSILAAALPVVGSCR
jgi:hypothetical protein